MGTSEQLRELCQLLYSKAVDEGRTYVFKWKLKISVILWQLCSLNLQNITVCFQRNTACLMHEGALPLRAYGWN